MTYDDLQFIIKKFEVLEEYFSALYFLPIEQLHKTFQKDKSQFFMIYNAWNEFKIFQESDKSRLKEIKLSLDNFQRQLLKLQEDYTNRNKEKNKLEEIYVSYSLEKSYELLAINPRMSFDEMKSCYHKKMHSNHPDKLESLGLDHAFIELAKDRTHALNKAWEIIKKHHQVKE